MEMLQQLKERYEKYEQDVVQLERDKTAFDGLFGMGNDPRKDPCHMRFYEDVGQWVGEFLKTAPDSEELYEAAHWLLMAPARWRETPVFWFMYASQGFCRELIPMLAPGECGRLLALFEQAYPRRDRMPVQKEVCRSLQKQAKR